jgi:GGDEF domain-containing protein
MAQLLLEGIRDHAVEGDAGDYEKFRSDMKNLESKLSPATPAAEVLVLAGSAVKQVEHYNLGATKFLSAKAAQVQNMLGMLTRTIGDVAAVDRESLARLKRIERRLEKASAIEDILAVKAHMEECLNHVREETELRTSQVEKLTGSIGQTGDQAQPPPEASEPLTADQTSLGEDVPVLIPDPLTGLHRRQAALRCFAKAVRVGRPQFVAVLQVRQLSAVNNRYGIEVGDSLLLAVCSRLEPLIGEGDELFRWSGKSLVATLSRSGELNNVAWELNRVIPKSARESFSFKSRSLMLNLGVEMSVLRVAELGRPNDLEAAIDRIQGNYAEV